MIELTPLFDNMRALDGFSIFIVILLFFLLNILIYILLGKLLKNNKKSMRFPLLIIFSFVYVLFIDNVYPMNSNQYTNEQVRNIITENVKAKYGLNIQNNHLNINNMEDYVPSEKYYATYDNDDRIYEVYFVRKDNALYLYAKNEKGVFLPVTTMLNKTTNSIDTLDEINNAQRIQEENEISE